MALAPKQLIRTNVTGTEVWLTDNTLAYAASVNIGGWGTPNPDLNKTAILWYVYQTVPSGDGTTSTLVPLTPLTSAIAYDAGNANTIQQSIGFGYHTDGHYTSFQMVFPASSDGTTYLAGGSIATGAYFYMNGGIYFKEMNSSNTLITPDHYGTLITVGAIIKKQDEKAFFNKLSVKNQLEYYRNYVKARNSNNPTETTRLLNLMSDLEQDLAGANWEFAAALYTQFENIVAELLEKHEITPP